MMIKKKSNPWARLKYLYVLPLAAVAVAAFARPEISNELNEISSVKVNDLASIVKTEEVISVENSSDKKFVLNGQVMKYPAKTPLVGASVIIRGTTIGTISDADGKFQLSVKKGDVVVVSFVGMQTQYVPVEGNSNLVVWMRDDVQKMEEMVVVGMASDGEGAPSVDPGKKVVSVVDIPKVEKGDTPQKEDVVFQVVEQMPEFPGGMQKAMIFLAKNMKYPVAAQKAKIEGRVIVQFIVKKDGTIADPIVMRGVSPELDAEALRVVSLMPNWKPGRQRGKTVNVKYTIPIMFRLQQDEPKQEEADVVSFSLKANEDTSIGTIEAVKNSIRATRAIIDVDKEESYEEKPLVVVDGKVMGHGTELLKRIDVASIQQVYVMSSKNAVAEYGDQAKDGAIVITFKKK
jgi:TonB family protein